MQGAGELLLTPAAAASPTFRQRQLLSEAAHRPWPVPESPWFMRQTWQHLLFAHWRVPARELQAVVPAELLIDTYDGEAWIGTTPFLVSGLRLRGTTPIPVLSRFPELNLRTYVTVGGKPGIYFLSLDAARRAAAAAARRSYRLPYFHSRISMHAAGGTVSFSSRRISGDGPAASFAADYRPTGGVEAADPGSLEYFLAERYCLYTLDERRRVHRGEIQHPPWPLQLATAEIGQNRMATPFGLRLEGEPLLHFSLRQDVLLWPIEPVGQ